MEAMFGSHLPLFVYVNVRENRRDNEKMDNTETVVTWAHKAQDDDKQYTQTQHNAEH
jgi:hypothetical protein